MTNLDKTNLPNHKKVKIVKKVTFLSSDLKINLTLETHILY